MKRPETTSKQVASQAGRTLASIRQLRKDMNRMLDAFESIAASALTQAADKPTVKRSLTVARKGKKPPK